MQKDETLDELKIIDTTNRVPSINVVSHFLLWTDICFLNRCEFITDQRPVAFKFPAKLSEIGGKLSEIVSY
mgnify:CR=1 FL=1